MLATLNLLAFLFPMVFAFVDPTAHVLRTTLGTRQTFFHDMGTLTRYVVFDSWEHLLAFMIQHLE